MFDDQNNRGQVKPLHGGNLTAAAETFGTPKDGWIDLSTGINAACYPNTDITENALRMLPTPGEVEHLLHAARHFYRVPPGPHIIAAPGTQSVLQNLPLLYPGRRVVILSPTYSEHRHTWEQAGNDVVAYTAFDELAASDIAVLVNPNNPDGRRYQPDELLKLAETVELLIIDEAFCDGSPDLSIVPHLGGGNILVLRSLGKFFGLAGLRLGFVIGAPEITQALEERLGPWAVSGPAIEIGGRALSDQAWIADMQETLTDQSARLNKLLQSHSLSIVGGTELFTLVETDKALNIYNALGKAGILVRRFEDQPHWLRIGLAGAENEWQRLAAALNAIDNMGE
ncbi:MAG: threonine-phosphate decarboxylase [Rhodospirillaceae bacterium]|nr:threonine-phosphate decarboxylase [Rhodospirillaceae bacterium]MBT4940286.1 threonine-phosphate decarboxylase [Rhodospirillaceae bacterium]MBT7265247.1 threonine-phosphate decarboxylase [Rhodospirillaceae bacterium]